MAATVVGTQTTWSVDRDEMTHRDYTIVHLVHADVTDGPHEILECPELPQKGDMWSFDNDLDVSARCTWEKKVTPVVSGEKNEYWRVESKFTTKPIDECIEDPDLDPLNEPYKISGGIVKYTEEGVFDFLGNTILNSAHEQIRGPQNEWDASRFTVRISWNVPDLELTLLQKYVDAVNDAQLWDQLPRSVKFSNFTWEQKYHGLCDVYYTRNLEFEIRRDGFDRSLLDEGTKVLNGDWNTVTGAWDLININGFAPNPLNPTHFVKSYDRKGNPMRVLLDGHGSPFVPNAVEVLKWWCVDDGVDPFVEQNTCSGIQSTGWYWGGVVKGPYDTEGEANATCEVGSTTPGIYVEDLVCAGAPLQPPKIRVKKYLQKNLLNLGIPTSLG